MPNPVQSAENPGTLERRRYPRKQLLFPWIKLGADNGGIILDISESGLAVQAVRSLTGCELPGMRFRLSESQAWIETSGRFAWIGPSKHTAGVEFTGLPEEARNRIRQWTPLALHPSGSVEGNPVGEKFEPVKDVPPAREPKSAISVPKSETTGYVDEHQSRHSVAENKTGVLPRTAETQDAETVVPHIRDKNANPTAAQSARYNTSPPRGLSYQGTTASRKTSDRGWPTASRKPSRSIGLTLTIAVVLLSACFFVVYRSYRPGNNSQGTEVRAAAKPADYSSGSSTNPTAVSVNPKLPSYQRGYVLQVGAMTHEDNALALAESLQQKNFLAFVFHREADRFYRVWVGPYPDADSAFKVKEELRKQNFDSIRMPWNP
jgi:septal ring-binding cell division protein DamX